MIRLLMISAFWITAFSAFSQVNSPYSNYGLGNLQSSKSNYFSAMGGIGYGVSSDLYINPSNPATYAAFDTLSFIFDIGLYSKSLSLNTVKQKETYNNAGVDYITFGFPIAKWWKTSFGVIPYSNVNYEMVSNESIPDVGNVAYNYSGSGGINKFYWGNSIKFGNTNYVSLGANVSYLFGTVKDVQYVSFPDSIYYFYTKNTKSITYKDLHVDFGAYYNQEFGPAKEYVFGLGAVYALGDDINTSSSNLSYTYILSSLNVDYVKDTLFQNLDVLGTVGLPQTFGVGLSLKKKNKFLVGADFEYQNWDTFYGFDVVDVMENSMRFAIGGHYVPGGETVSSYWRWVRYRAGFYYNQSGLQLNNTAINEIGITFGVGLPLRRSRSTINLGVEIGNRGTTDKNLIQETFVNFRLGFSIYETWFIQRKFH